MVVSLVITSLELWFHRPTDEYLLLAGFVDETYLLVGVILKNSVTNNSLLRNSRNYAMIYYQSRLLEDNFKASSIELNL